MKVRDIRPARKVITKNVGSIELDEASDPNAYSYFMQQRVGGSLGSEWSVFTYEENPGNNPIHLRKMLTSQAKSMGWDGYDVVAMWKGDMNDAYADAQEKLSSGKNWIKSYENDLNKTVRDIDKAKEIMANGEEGQEIQAEARDPMGVINKFLKQKDAKDARAEELVKDRSKVKQMALDRDLEEDKVKPENKYRARVIRDLGNGTYRVVVANKTRSYQDPITAPRSKMYDELIGLGYHDAARDWQQHIGGPVDEALNEGMPPVTKTVVVTSNGKPVKEIKLQAHQAQPHHIAMELRRQGLGIPEVELYNAARELAQGKTWKQGTTQMSVKGTRPREMR